MITVISAVRNEAHRIETMIDYARCIIGVDQIIIIDGKSDDGTADIARSLDCEVYEGDNLQYGEYARRLAIPHVKNDWVLILDADEIPSEWFADHAIDLARSNKKGFWIPEALYIAGEQRCVEKRYRFMRKDRVDFIDLLHSPPMPKAMTESDFGYVSEVCIEHRKTWKEVIWGEERYERQAVEMGRPEVDRLNFHLHLLREKGITADEADTMTMTERINAGIGYDPKLYEILEDTI